MGGHEWLPIESSSKCVAGEGGKCDTPPAFTGEAATTTCFPGWAEDALEAYLLPLSGERVACRCRWRGVYGSGQVAFPPSLFLPGRMIRRTRGPDLSAGTVGPGPEVLQSAKTRFGFGILKVAHHPYSVLIKGLLRLIKFI